MNNILEQKSKFIKNKKLVKLAGVGGLTSFLAACGAATTFDVSGTATEDEILTANLVGAGLTGISYQWQRDGVDIAGATGATYTLVQADVGTMITAVVDYTDGDGKADSATSDATPSVANINDFGVVNIAGNVAKGETLTANVVDEDGFGAITYKWQRDGVDIVGATGVTYTLEQVDIGTIITAKVDYTDDEGAVESVTSGPTVAVSAGAVVKLADLDGTNGARFDGVAANDESGIAVSLAGDVNGDGYDDFIIGAFLAQNGGNNSGSSYVVFGRAGGFSADMSLSALDGSNGFRLDGVNADDYSGFSVSAAGDVNGDGFDDIIIGAYAADDGGSSSGSSYVVFGKVGGFAAAIDLSTLNGTTGFRLDGGAISDNSGVSVSSAGDVNGDGYDDVIVGAYLADNVGNASGSSYVVFGQASGFAAAISLPTLTGNNGFRLDGVAATDNSGISVSSAGDVNGDGYDDIIVGANQADNGASGSGSSYVVFGKASGFAATMSLSTLNGNNGFRIDGSLLNENSGSWVSTAGDVNGDGFDDIIIGAANASNGSTGTGSSYIVFGKASGFAANMSLSTLDGTNGFRLDGVNTSDFSGVSVSFAGDVNGDGYDDIIVGAIQADNGGNNASGSSYVIFGKASGFDAVTSLDDLDGTNGFRLDGVAAGDRSGREVSAAGDVNGDGYDDIIVGAFTADNGGSDSGSSYVVYGGGQFAASAQAATVGDDVLNGTALANTLSGGEGDDSLNGLADADILKGGVGNDDLTGGTGADRIWGGGDLDIFNFTAGDSQITISGAADIGTVVGYDIIYDFDTNHATVNSETYKVGGGASVVTDSGTTNGVDSSLTIGGNVIKSHTISDGIIKFDDADAFATELEISNEGEIAAVLQYLQLQDLGNAGATVTFDVGADSFIFTQGDDAGTNDLDIVVRLEDVQLDSLITSNGFGSFDLFIA